MPTPAERRALVFLAALAALGVAARGVLDRTEPARPDASAVRALDGHIATVDAATKAARTAKRAVPAGGRAPAASAASAARGTGRKASGSTGRPPVARGTGGAIPDAVHDPAVRGQGRDPLDRYEARRLAVERSNAEARARVAQRAAELATTARSGPAGGDRWPPRSAPAKNPAEDRNRFVDMDTAGPDALETLPGIGPSLASRIAEDRRTRGPFGSLEGLQRVKGIGPGLAERIAPFVTFSRRLSAPPTLTRLPVQRRIPPRP